MKFSSAKSFNMGGALARAVLVVLGIAMAAFLQFAYDSYTVTAASVPIAPLSPDVVKMVDLGLDSTVASYAWVGTMPDILTLSNQDQSFIQGLNFVNAVDPRLSFPYSFAVIVLPVSRRYSNRVQESIDVGQRGIKNADPDWKIPFYMATMYYFELKDKKTATYYFDLAGRTPGAPKYIRTFGDNFGSATRVRDETKSIWIAVYQSATDNDTKERALEHLQRIQNLEFLEDAAAAYKKEFGTFPKTLGDLVTKRIINEIPPDPFGFTYYITNAGTVEVKVD